MLRRWRVAVVGKSHNWGKIDHMMEGNRLLAWLVVAGHGRNDEEAVGGGRPYVVAACRKRRVRIRGEVGSPLGARSLGVRGVDSKDRNEDGEAVCASDWE